MSETLLFEPHSLQETWKPLSFTPPSFWAQHSSPQKSCHISYPLVLWWNVWGSDGKEGIFILATSCRDFWTSPRHITLKPRLSGTSGVCVWGGKEAGRTAEGKEGETEAQGWELGLVFQPIMLICFFWLEIWGRFSLIAMIDGLVLFPNNFIMFVTFLIPCWSMSLAVQLTVSVSSFTSSSLSSV